MSGSTLLSYRIIYARWLRFCSLPKKHGSLRPYCVIKIFGRKFLTTLLPFFMIDVKERANFVRDQVSFNNFISLNQKTKIHANFEINIKGLSNFCFFIGLYSLPFAGHWKINRFCIRFKKKFELR